MATLEKNRSLVELGVYQKGSNPKLDRVLSLQDALEHFLRQGTDEAVRAGAAQAALAKLMGQGA
jgi:flagellar biosynthesis/type III secretory pathway ATPase